MKPWLNTMVSAFCVCLAGGVSAQQNNVVTPTASVNTELFAFSLPGDEATEGVTDLAFLNDKPAADLVSVRDGQFYAGGKRIRFWGINNCFTANFPEHDEARLLARRFASLGMNLLRITETDCHYAPRGLFDPKYPGQLRILPSQLDKLDYFIAELKRQGVYVELSLHIQHWLNITGPAEIPGMEAEKFPGFAGGQPWWNEKFVAAEKQWARDFLGHVNPYTGKAYTEEPAVAYVEIVNENGIISAWNRGCFRKSWPPAMVADLQTHWNKFLQARYSTSDRLRRAWASGEATAADPRNLLQNADFAKGRSGWALQCVKPSSAEIEVVSHGGPNGLPCVAIRSQCASPKGFVNLNQSGFAIEKGCVYRLTFQARADKPLQLHASVSMADSPGLSLGLANRVEVATTWQKITRDFIGADNGPGSRLRISLPVGDSRVSLAGFSLKKADVAGLPPGETMEAGGISMPWTPADCVARTKPVAMDFADFLFEVDQRYFATMYAFLKDELACKHPIKGTQADQYSSCFSQARCDFIDAHGYWQMPVFTGKQWDLKNWSIANTPMVNQSCALAVKLAGCRVKGKPYVVSEYCHPAPSTYCSEEVPTVTAFAAFQDWDGITLYSWAHEGRSNYTANRIPEFFDHNRHPLKLVTMPFGAMAFRRGDVAVARKETAIGVTRDDERQWLAGSLQRPDGSWFFHIADRKGASWLDFFTHRICLALGSDRVPPFIPSDLKRAQSDTGQLVCDVTDPARGMFIVNAPRAKAVIGFGAGKTFELGDLTLKPGPTRQHGFSVITAMAVRGTDFHSPGASLLVTATGYAENTAMGWNADKTSVSNNWGQEPVLCEGIPFELVLQPKAIRAWALDVWGRRAKEVPVIATPSGSLLRLGPQYRTLWYEIAIDKP